MDNSNTIEHSAPITERQLEKIFWRLFDIFRAAPVDELKSIDLILKLIFIKRMTDLVSPSNKEISREKVLEAWGQLNSMDIQKNSLQIENMLTGALTGAAIGGLSTEKEEKMTGILLGAIGGSLLSYFFEENSNSKRNQDCINNIQKIFDKLEQIPLFSGIFKYTEIDSDGLHFIKNALDVLKGYSFSLNNISIEIFGRVWSGFIAKYYSIPRLGNGYSVNSKVISMIISILNPLPGQKYYDPSNRDQQLFIEAHRKAKINEGDISLCGQILGSLSSYSIAKMTLIANGVLNFKLNYGGDFFSPDYLNFDADVAVSTTIPFNMRYNVAEQKKIEDIFKKYPATNSIEFNYLYLMLENTNSSGTVALCLPNGLLVSQREKDVRNYLLGKDLIDCIIELPKNSFLNISASTSMIILKKKTPFNRKGKVLMVNASRYDFKDLEEVSELVLNWEEKQDVSKIIGINDYESKNHSLLPSSYVFGGSEEISTLIEKSKFTTIEQIVNRSKLGRTLKINEDEMENLLNKKKIPFIRVSDIKMSQTGFDLELNPVKQIYPDVDGAVFVEKVPSVLVTLIGENIKAGIINKSVAISSDIVFIDLNENLILAEFFIYQLRSQTTKAQISAMISGTTIPRIKWSDFLNVKIYVPSLETQKAVLVEYKAKQLSEFKAQIKIEDVQENWISSLIHQLGHDISKIRNIYNDLEFFLQSKIRSGETLRSNDFIVPGEEKVDTLDDTMKKLRKNVDCALSTLKRTEISAKGQIAKTTFKAITFLNEIVTRYQKNDSVIFNVLGKDHSIEADKQFLETVFTNLIDNSLSHGFVDDCSHIINIDVSIVKKHKDSTDFIRFFYYDDGIGWPEGFTFDKFISYGKTGGSTGGQGIGGWDINNIIIKHDGEFSEVKLEKGVGFEILIPIRKEG
ncbi:MAG TPA: N-6 DNA methylase [bacterium]|nr:N-6 DNA methylase [bacterium]